MRTRSAPPAGSPPRPPPSRSGWGWWPCPGAAAPATRAARRLGRRRLGQHETPAPTARRSGRGARRRAAGGAPDQAAKPADAARPPSRRSTYDRKLARRADISITVADVDAAAAKVRAIAASAKGLVDGRGDLERARRPGGRWLQHHHHLGAHRRARRHPRPAGQARKGALPQREHRRRHRAVRRHRVAGQDDAGQRRPGACADEPGHQARRRSSRSRPSSPAARPTSRPPRASSPRSRTRWRCRPSRCG